MLQYFPTSKPLTLSKKAARSQQRDHFFKLSKELVYNMPTTTTRIITDDYCPSKQPSMSVQVQGHITLSTVNTGHVEYATRVMFCVDSAVPSFIAICRQKCSNDHDCVQTDRHKYRGDLYSPPPPPELTQKLRKKFAPRNLLQRLTNCCTMILAYFFPTSFLSDQ